MGIIKTFRGKLTDGGQDKIYLAGGEPDIGYRLIKFQMINDIPGTLDFENVLKIYKTKQDPVDGVVDFTDDSLLAAAFTSGDATANNYPEDQTVVFDRIVVNQDLYVTNKEVSGNASLQNYYLEFEEVKMSGSEQAVVNFEAALLHGE